ncbi:MAG TPA: dTDP-4-dehydrorhamnose reductase [Hyphomicrobiaceae bacterium]
MRLLIAGWQGQVARALVELAPSAADVEAFAVGRPGLDLCNAATIKRAMTDFHPDVIINSAAYTAVDKAESEQEAAFALNRTGAGLLAEEAAKRGAAIIHISTDYVFDGRKSAPYAETDAVAPQNVYGHSKLQGEQAVRQMNPEHVIARTAWVYSATGSNFVKTMLRLAGERDSLRVVDDQIGNPTYAPHLAKALLEIARKVRHTPRDDQWGTYHLAGLGDVSWCGFAREVFRVSAELGGPSASVTSISTADYPTPAARPKNSRLDCSKAEQMFGVALPDWREGVRECVTRLLAK